MGPSELRVTKAGIYWINGGNAKPGKHDRQKEPTYVNGQPWQPEWKDGGKERGTDTSEVHAIALEPAKLQLQLIAVGDTRDASGIEKRDAIKVKLAGEELSVVIPDSQFGARWYKFVLTQNPTARPFSVGAAASTASRSGCRANS